MTYILAYQLSFIPDDNDRITAIIDTTYLAFYTRLEVTTY